ncbi:hypothetical protein C7W93_12890 [Glaciimonas sp. PCH181]|nr:hypothetical protein C7W93_12890 [Glaciimonas sp. PCH181]
MLLMLSACALPDTQVKTGSVSPSLSIHGAPPNAVLYVDGLAVGNADQYNGTKILAIEEGMHQIQIKQGERVLHAEKIVVSSGETRTVTMNRGDQ